MLQLLIWLSCFHRFDESGISPLTIKALSSAGYIHMTRVQEASLPVCLQGMLRISFRAIQFLFLICFIYHSSLS